MKKVLILSLVTLLVIITSCKEEDTLSKTTFEGLFGKLLHCKYQSVNTQLYFFSPHIIGVPVNEKDFEFEYFHSVGSKTSTNSLYYETSFKGKRNFQTKQSVIDNNSRRLRLTIRDEKVYVTAISKIDEKKIPVDPILYECSVKDSISFSLK